MVRTESTGKKKGYSVKGNNSQSYSLKPPEGACGKVLPQAPFSLRFRHMIFLGYEPGGCA